MVQKGSYLRMVLIKYWACADGCGNYSSGHACENKAADIKSRGVTIQSKPDREVSKDRREREREREREV